MAISTIHQNVFSFLMDYRKNNEDFFFGLRQLNRNARLEKGYWFLGNDYYISIPFWAGRDNATKSPRATFIIVEDGTTYLEINSKTIQKPFFTLDLFKKLGFETLSLGQINRKYYSDFGTDYLSSLKSFLSGDKLVIDEFVTQEANSTSENILEKGGIDFIWPATFNYQLKIINKYKKIHAEKERKTGYIRSLKIRKFGRIENLSVSNIPQGCRWVFLTGENGSGKTTILRALAAAITRNNDNGTEVAVNYKNFNIQLGLETISGIERKTVKGTDDFSGKTKLTKGFAAYGPVRLLSQGSLNGDLTDLDKNRISQRTTFGLFNPISILRDISSDYILNVKPKDYDMTVNDFLENVEANLELILPNITKVNIVRSEKGTRILYHQSGRTDTKITEGVEFDQLPSGTRNFAALILDLLLRFTEQQDVSDISDFVGTVLIDEIDLHLHPKMQKEIIVQLSETFPNIQFIVTTHSPIPMLGAPPNSIFVNVQRDEENRICAKKLDIEIVNLLPNSILSSPIFGFDELINKNHDPQEGLMTEDDYNEAIFYRILEKKIRERTITPQDNDTSTN